MCTAFARKSKRERERGIGHADMEHTRRIYYLLHPRLRARAPERVKKKKGEGRMWAYRPSGDLRVRSETCVVRSEDS